MRGNLSAVQSLADATLLLGKRKAIATMALCVACNKPLTLFIESAEEDEEMETMEGSASANTSSYVDDDLQLQCGCHFHWSVHYSKWKGRTIGLTCSPKGNVSSTLTLYQNVLTAEEIS